MVWWMLIKGNMSCISTYQQTLLSSQHDSLYEDSECNPTETTVILLHFLKVVEFELLKWFTFISFVFFSKAHNSQRKILGQWQLSCIRCESLCWTVRSAKIYISYRAYIYCWILKEIFQKSRHFLLTWQIT
jgi:hypothetical protein